jgi:DNA-binding ferritin-like protein (Dps family)
MDNMTITATRSCPAVDFKAESGELEIRGESYPEHALKFYEPVLQWIQEYLETCSQPVILTVDMVYFNSSSSKILMSLFDMLEEAAANGKKVTVRWLHHVENEVALECGEEFKEETRYLDFQLIPYGDD